MRFKRYKSELEYSYALGAAPVIELISACPGDVIGVYVSPGYKPGSDADIFGVCAQNNLPCEVNQKFFNIAADKENIYVAAVFRKRAASLNAHLPHAVFVNPGDAGNLGTNIRTCLGFDFLDIAVIRPGADVYAPKTVRASMGALFHVRSACFSSFGEYAATFPKHIKYFFMLNGKTELNSVPAPRDGRVSLVFGNEATGLPDEYLQYGNSVRIPHSGAIDSLNLSVAAGIATNAFYKLRQSDS